MHCRSCVNHCNCSASVKRQTIIPTEITQRNIKAKYFSSQFDSKT
ncbi:hypothetical protein COY52_08195 [Candidatus Desantisbacteria bacterium CG_4_10_14_0_8_um_filter_48_22]|uniref:Zinc-finger domain-containing protein n=1 Tax=Candidatus Desantisbacteria bacterium CG_4_10_14_0_8_um_filter_48_22 TaxID=1974543 RepID=A0A2M7S970_9BACT|nr:MAG: hypothetical protein COY52_08195 [Candidatus Desantisbacteria bacterium CG_4_10_14_0_8_um_filter_48_22]